MDDRSQLHRVQLHSQPPHSTSPTKSQVLTVVTLLPIGAILLGLAGMIFVGTVFGLAVVSPLLVIFSPVIVPAMAFIGLVVTGFITSGTFGLTGLSSLSWVLNSFRNPSGVVDEARGKMKDIAVYAGEKTKDLGKAVEEKAQESVGEKTEAKAQEGAGETAGSKAQEGSGEATGTKAQGGSEGGGDAGQATEVKAREDVGQKTQTKDEEGGKSAGQKSKKKGQRG